ncbi:MAG: hypothetical protein P1T08_00975 [Acidimicrobiia bacterium]|nr:hypothetical protein [Acidimicrobiia bacterium]
MALTLTRELTGIDAVAEACLDVYRSTGEVADLMTWNRLFLGESIHQTPGTPTVIVRSTRTIECVLPHRADPADYLPGFLRMVGEEWTVRLLVHSSEIGTAHRRLRGTPITIQPWWYDGGFVHFGRPEIP